MDRTPEEKRRLWEEAQHYLDETGRHVEELMAERAAWLAEHGEVTWTVPEPSRPVQCTQRAPERPSRELENWWQQKAQELGMSPDQTNLPSDYWDKWRKWAEAIVDRKIKAFAESYGEEIGKFLAEIGNEDAARTKAADAVLAERITALENTVTELMSALERKVDDLERRAVLKPTRPQLVGGPDAA